jgi:hypothetical protein
LLNSRAYFWFISSCTNDGWRANKAMRTALGRAAEMSSSVNRPSVKVRIRRVERALCVSILGLAVVRFPAAGCDEPGTPNRVLATPISPSAIWLHWNNTASESGVYFDIEGRSDPSIGNFGPYNRGRDNPVDYNVSNLRTGIPHCFRIWARVGYNGCRSKVPSAWVCATPLTTSKDPRDIGGGALPHGPIGGSVGGGRNPPPKGNPSPPNPPPPPACGVVGAACSASNPCCNNARNATTAGQTPELCVYGFCKACVPHNQECKAFGTQICCDPNDICKLDQSSGKAVCDIPDGKAARLPGAPLILRRCAQGYVWREASPADDVCVTPESRAQTQIDNRRAERETCKAGHVWREAFAGDHLCVSPETRARVAQENRERLAHLAR